MTAFADVMQSAVLDLPVIDRTNLTGRFDFTLRWTPDESQCAGLGIRVPPPAADPTAPPTVFTAIQEQLGLRFESTRAPVEVMAIDRIDKPSANENASAARWRVAAQSNLSSVIGRSRIRFPVA
jgi:uncharacterized protein (TIGR03435 family)